VPSPAGRRAAGDRDKKKKITKRFVEEPGEDEGQNSREREIAPEIDKERKGERKREGETMAVWRQREEATLP